MNIEKITNNLGYNFKDIAFIELAFTHSSYSYTHHEKSNERLEFLGDSILNFVTTDFLYNNFDKEEGYLSKLKAYLVSAENLSKIVDELGIINELKCENFSPKQSKNVKCDLFESIIGAIYLDGGFENAKTFIYSKLNLEKSSVLNAFEKVRDYKSKLQEIIQKNGKNTIEYVLINKSLDSFEIMLKIDGKQIVTCTAKSKKEAEILCAEKACELLENNN